MAAPYGSRLLFYTTVLRQARPIVVKLAADRETQTKVNEIVRKITYILLAVIGVLAAALVWLWWSATDLDQKVDFKASLLSPKPNQFLVCPDVYCKDKAHQIAPTYRISKTALRRLWDEMMDRKTGFERLNLADGEDRRHYDKRTDGLGFPDRMTVEFVAVDDETSSLAIYSRSKYGYSDRGFNKARILMLLQDLEKRLP